jgi:hypothetical protein
MPDRPRDVALVLSPAAPADAVAVDAMVRAGGSTMVGVGVHYAARAIRYAQKPGRVVDRSVEGR